MIISLVNPHDVLLYPKKWLEAGYFDLWLEGNVRLPQTLHENLSTKPSAQRQILNIMNLGLGRLTTRREKLNYVNFYANLMRASDANLVEVIKALQSTKLLEKTLIIRTADHGEMGLAHNGMRQKNFNFYEETLRVPLIYSNPRLFKAPRKSSSLVSHVDFLPTLATLFGAPRSARADWQGVDYSREILNPRAPASQDYIVFTYDDYQSGQKNGPYPKPPNHIVSLREQRWKLAKYYDIHGRVAPQWEMYDLKTDPLETTNLAYPSYKRTHEQHAQYERLTAKLARIKKTRLDKL
jgi:arylsulfatase A-like enzyme